MLGQRPGLRNVTADGGEEGIAAGHRLRRLLPGRHPRGAAVVELGDVEQMDNGGTTGQELSLAPVLQSTVQT